MSSIAMPVIALIGVSASAALYHFLLFLFTHERETLIFSAAALLIAFYTFACFRLYTSFAMTEGIRWQRIQMAVLSLLAAAMLWFAVVFTGHRGRLAPWVLTGWNVIQFFCVLLIKSPLALSVEQEGIKKLNAGSSNIAYYEAHPGIILQFQTAVGFLTIAFFFFLIFRYMRKKNKQEGMLVACGLIFLTASAIHDTLLSFNVIRSVYSMEYGYGFLLIIISIALALRRNRLTRMIEAKEEQFRGFIEESPQAILITDQSDRIIFLNKKFVDLFGYSREDIPSLTEWWAAAYPEKNYRDKVIASWNKDMEEGRKGKPIENRRFFVWSKTGEAREIEFQFKKIGELGLNLLTDVTEKRKSEELLIQYEKMNAVANLAAGMAHELSNPITGITGIAQSILGHCKEDASLHEEMQYLDHLSKRTGETLNIILSFIRRSYAKKLNTDIHELLHNAVDLLQTDYDLINGYPLADIEIVTEFCKDLPAVPCIPNEIRQVFLHVIKNSVQAFGEKPERPPQIQISTGLAQTAGSAPVYGVSSIEIIISDNGLGIEKSEQHRIFEPFYSTKGRESGGGMGLAAAYFIIVNNHNGTIAVDSDRRKGTTFTITLPLESS